MSLKQVQGWINDGEGRTALHYSTVSKRPEEMFNFISDRVMETQIRDLKGNTASYYMQKPHELGIDRRELMRNGLTRITPTRKKKSPPSKKTSPAHKMRTPPKREGLNITGANIRIWIHDQDLARLEQIVNEGQGHRLLNETSNQPKVRQFLQLVPRMMTKIKEVHQAAISGDLEAMEAKADKPEILLAKDHNGLNPLHRAAALGHSDMCEWIVNKNGSTVFGVDRKGRSPLHYGTNPTDGGEIYDILVKGGADPTQVDHFNRTPAYYRGRPGEIDLSIVYEPPSAPRMGGVSLGDNSFSGFPSRSNSGGRHRSFESVYHKSYRNVREKERRRGKLRGSYPYKNSYIKGKKDFTGKRKYVDMKNVSEKEIDKMIQDAQVDQLEYVVLSGRGGALRERTSWNDQVRRFLKKVPSYMEKIDMLQAYSAEGNLEMTQKITRENNKYAMGRNKDGAIPLHFAAQSGNAELAKHLLELYPDGLFAEDRYRRAPIHYAAISRAPGSHKTYDLLERRGAFVHACDVEGKSADAYFRETNPKIESETQSRESRSTSRNSLTLQSLTPREDEAINTDSKSQSRSRSRSLSKSPARRYSKSMPTNITKSKSQSLTRGQSKSPARRNPDSPLKVESKIATRRKSQDSIRSKSKSPSRYVSPSPNKLITEGKSNASRESKSTEGMQSNTNKSESPPKPKKRRRRIIQPRKDEEVERAIRDAENEDYKGISRIILRGDGHRLVGTRSNNDEVQGFLNGLPDSLKTIKEIQSAVERGDLRNTQHLIDRREKAYVKDANQSNLLHTAAINGHTDVVRYLVQSFPDLINQQDINGRTPLHYASVLRDGGHILKILKMSNGDPYIRDNFGRNVEDYVIEPEFLPHRALLNELVEGKAHKEREESEFLAENEDDDEQYEEEEYEEEENQEEENQEEEEKHEEKNEEEKHVEENTREEGKQEENSKEEHEDAISPKSQTEQERQEPSETEPVREDDQEEDVQETMNDMVERPGTTLVQTCTEEENEKEEEEGAKDKYEEEREADKGDQADCDHEVEAAILAAERGEYEPLSDIVRRGDGRFLINKTSSDEEVQTYLDKIPFILGSIDELFRTVESGDTRRTSLLLDRKDKAKVRTVLGANLLHVAVINGHTDTVRFLVQSHPALLRDVDVDGRTPLHYAATVQDGGHIYKILKRANADPSHEDKMVLTPEHYLNDENLLSQETVIESLRKGSTPSAKSLEEPRIADDGKDKNEDEDDEGEEEKEEERPITKDSVVSYYGSEEEGMQTADESTIQIIEEAYKKLQNSNSKSLLKKHLTQEVFDSIKHRVTENGATLLDVINSGVVNQDSHIGVYAPDAESYVLFKELFDPIVEDYHTGYINLNDHPTPDYGDYELLGNLDDMGNYVISTRIRCARSLEGYPFNPKMTIEQYIEVEQDVEAAVDLLDGEFAGYYTFIGDLTAEESQRLEDEHLLFSLEENSSKFLRAAGATHFWPKGRGIFLNSDSTFIVWVNEEDHLRIISMQKDGDVRAVYERFVEGLFKLEERLHFSYSQRLGFLNFCPTNLGTAIRASVHIRLPNLGKIPEKLEDIANQFHLQVRGTRGEHSEANDFVFDISNKRRVGLTEVEAIQDMYEGAMELITIEKDLEEQNAFVDEKGNPRPESEPKEPRETEIEDDASRYPGFWTEDGHYLSETIADILIKAVADVNQQRPSDPIGHLAVALYTLRFIPQDFSKNSTIQEPSNKSENPSSGSSNESTILKKNVFQGSKSSLKSLDAKISAPRDSGQKYILNHRTEDGANILHYAASIPHEKTVMFKLIKDAKNAKISDRDQFFLTPRDVATESLLTRNIIEIDQWVLKFAAEGNINELKELLLDGYEYVTSLEDLSERSIIEIASINGQENMVEFLQLASAFEERKEFLHKVIKAGSLPHVEFLADSEDIVRAKDDKGRTSLHLSILCEEGSIIVLFANKFPFLLSVPDNLGRTPLHYAMGVENVDEIAKILVQAGAKRTVKDMRGKLPSYYFMNRKEIVNMIKEIYREDVESAA